MMRIMSVVGARPNFMKVAPLIDAMSSRHGRIEHCLVHTGQHYDARMSDAFFSDLAMPRPDVNLGVGSGSHAQQTARTMLEIEPVLERFGPDVLIVVGDVNSTIACALAARKMGIDVAHVEAGLRSFDMTMPEEINRRVTDAISDFLFTTDRIADANLAREGVDPSRVFFVGNVMIDSLLCHLEKARALGFARSLGLEPGGYGTMTLHRPANVDSAERFGEILDAIRDGIGDLPVIFPIHPRTRQRIDAFGLSGRFADAPGAPGIWLTGPLGYLEFLNLNAGARIVLTDSGGLQEETTILGVSCVTLRENTERPITMSQGTNRLAGTCRKGILSAIASALDQSGEAPARPEKWDGQAAERIIEILLASHLG
jgi:UDP-N-acetylglucosamine 2-epimerase (non-hydrolysing)